MLVNEANEVTVRRGPLPIEAELNDVLAERESLPRKLRKLDPPEGGHDSKIVEYLLQS